MRKEIGTIEIPALGLGTWRMKGQECIEAVEHALNMGYRHIDTAEMYDNERQVGLGIKKADVDREDIFLTTKVWHTHLDYGGVKRAAHNSLDRIDTSYVDLLLIHWPNTDVPLEETFRAMRELKDDGLVNHIGVSNFTVELLDKALLETDEIIANQVEMHVFHQQQKLHRYCMNNRLFLTAYSPLARGRVTENEVLQEIGEKYDKTAAQVALRWLIQQENVLAIPKAVPEELQRENLGATEFKLADEDMQRIFKLDERKRLVNPGFAPW